MTNTIEVSDQDIRRVLTALVAHKNRLEESGQTELADEYLRLAQQIVQAGPEAGREEKPFMDHSDK